MASLSRDPTGWRVLFIGVDGRRKAVRLGEVPAKTARDFKTRIETLVSWQGMGQPIDNEMATWLSKLSEQHAKRMAKCGLAPARKRSTMSEFVTSYQEQRKTDIKDTTVRNLKRTGELLV